MRACMQLALTGIEQTAALSVMTTASMAACTPASSTPSTCQPRHMTACPAGAAGQDKGRGAGRWASRQAGRQAGCQAGRPARLAGGVQWLELGLLSFMGRHGRPTHALVPGQPWPLPCMQQRRRGTLLGKHTAAGALSTKLHQQSTHQQRGVVAIQNAEQSSQQAPGRLHLSLGILQPRDRGTGVLC